MLKLHYQNFTKYLSIVGEILIYALPKKHFMIKLYIFLPNNYEWKWIYMAESMKLGKGK